MDHTLRIFMYFFVHYKNNSGISIKIVLDDGKLAILQRAKNKFRIMQDGKCIMFIGFTHPDFNLCKKIYVERERVINYRRINNKVEINFPGASI